MSIPIQNGSDTLLTQNSGTLPNMQDAIADYFQQMTFVQIAKVVNGQFQLKETPTNIDFLGVWQPTTPQKLAMRPEGQRKWNWFTVHTQPNVPLEPDDVVLYLGVQYRVMEKSNYSLYAYIEYHLVNDYTGSGPE